MKRQTLILILLSVLSLQLSAQWELRIDRDSIQVYTKPNADGYSYYKASGYVYAKMTDVYTFLTSVEDFPSWVNNCVDSEVLSREGDEVVYFVLYEMPWPVSDRYSITQITIDKMDDYQIQLQSNPYLKIKYDYEDALRIVRFNEKVKLTNIGEELTFVEMFGAYDPGGSIPLWLSDKFMKYGPLDAILGIKSHLE